MAHTQGPWSLDDVACDSYGDNDVIRFWVRGFPGNECLDGMVVASVVSDCLDKSVEANARLIAAAPELLEALELAAETFRRYEGHHRAKQTPDAFEKALANQALAVLLEAVIAKAKGLNPDQG